MKFGGHETFYLRPGWLTKGLFLVRDHNQIIWNSDFASDTMGVGRNMSKSIGWWLSLTGLVHRPTQKEALQLTSFGKMVIQHDPYLSHTNSWWFIHLSIILGGQDDVFTWFFQKSSEDRFKKNALEGCLVTHLESQGETVPTPKTLDRDISVLLHSYARPIPAPKDQDPEDNLDCPLRRLGLLVHRRDLDDYERRATSTRIPAEVVAATLNLLQKDRGIAGQIDVPLDFAGTVRRAGKIFGLSAEVTAEEIMHTSEILGYDLLSIRHLAGQRVVTLRKAGIADWYQYHFKRKAMQQSIETANSRVA